MMYMVPKRRARTAGSPPRGSSSHASSASTSAAWEGRVAEAAQSKARPSLCSLVPDAAVADDPVAARVGVGREQQCGEGRRPGLGDRVAAGLPDVGLQRLDPRRQGRRGSRYGHAQGRAPGRDGRLGRDEQGDQHGGPRPATGRHRGRGQGGAHGSRARGLRGGHVGSRGGSSGAPSRGSGRRQRARELRRACGRGYEIRQRVRAVPGRSGPGARAGPLPARRPRSPLGAPATPTLGCDVFTAPRSAAPRWSAPGPRATRRAGPGATTGSSRRPRRGRRGAASGRRPPRRR